MRKGTTESGCIAGSNLGIAVTLIEIQKVFEAEDTRKMFYGRGGGGGGDWKGSGGNGGLGESKVGGFLRHPQGHGIENGCLACYHGF